MCGWIVRTRKKQTSTTIGIGIDGRCFAPTSLIGLVIRRCWIARLWFDTLFAVADSSRRSKLVVKRSLIDSVLDSSSGISSVGCGKDGCDRSTKFVVVAVVHAKQEPRLIFFERS